MVGIASSGVRWASLYGEKLRQAARHHSGNRCLAAAVHEYKASASVTTLVLKVGGVEEDDSEAKWGTRRWLKSNRGRVGHERIRVPRYASTDHKPNGRRVTPAVLPTEPNGMRQTSCRYLVRAMSG